VSRGKRPAARRATRGTGVGSIADLGIALGALDERHGYPPTFRRWEEASAAPSWSTS